MGTPKIDPCPNCKTADKMYVFKYDHGGQHVECDRCYYLGPCESSKRQAIKSHNVRRREQQLGDHDKE